METEWLGTLLNTKFFSSCHLHPNARNKFCIDCSVSFCKICTVHDLHRHVYIRKYVYQDVVRVQDMDKYFRCSEIHSYKVNGEISVHLNSRGLSADTAKSPKTKSGSCPCEECGRHVQDPHRFCSIACKVSVKSKLKDGSIGTVISQSRDLDSLLLKEEKTSRETNASEMESTISMAESTEETKVGSPSSSRPRKHRRKGIPHRAPFF